MAVASELYDGKRGKRVAWADVKGEVIGIIERESIFGPGIVEVAHGARITNLSADMLAILPDESAPQDVPPAAVADVVEDNNNPFGH